MERVELFCQGEKRGDVTLCPEGVRTQIRCGMTDPGDGLYRAYLVGEGGELALGVMEPGGDGRLALCRRLYSREVRAVGPPLRGEARCSFRFREAAWQETGCPAKLFRDEFLVRRLGTWGRAWWRRDRGVLYLALPLAEDQPFPLEALFCLARVEQISGQTCAVFAFRDETPLLP